jgi:hypothetical protein
MFTMQPPVTEVGQCPLYRILVAEQQSLDATILRLANGEDARYEPLNARSRVAGMIQHSICRRRTFGERLSSNALSHIEEAVSQLSESEQSDIVNALAVCRTGCAFGR